MVFVMIVVLFSNDSEMVRTRALKMIKADFPTRDETNYVNLNMTVSSVRELAEECEMLSLGAERKCVVGQNCFFLSKSKTKAKLAKDDSIEPLLAYCKNPNAFVDLYLLVYGEVDPKNEIIKAISATGSIKEIPIPKAEDWIEYAKKTFREEGIEEAAASEIVKRVGNDYGRFIGELSKLKNYANGERLTLKAVQMLVAPKLEDDAFKMSNHLLKGQIEEATRIYQNLKVYGTDEIRLINMLASQFRFLDMVRFLDARGLSSSQIASTLGEKPIRVDIGLRNLYAMRPDSLPRIMEDLYVCQKRILTGEADERFAFELFLATFEL